MTQITVRRGTVWYTRLLERSGNNRKEQTVHTVELSIDDWDDRSGNPEPGPHSFRFVYFNDDSRVGYAPAVIDGMPVFEPRTNGGGRYVPVTQEHFDMACDFLRAKGII